MEVEQNFERIMKRPEMIVHETVKHLEKTRNFRAFITPQIVLKSVHSRIKKNALINCSQEELLNALSQAECDGLVYRVQGTRKADSIYLMSREHVRTYGQGAYAIVPFENNKFFSPQLRNIVYQILLNTGPKYATEIHRIIQLDMQKFLNYELEYFRRHVLPDPLKHPERSWVRLDNGKYSIKPEGRKKSSFSKSSHSSPVVANKPSEVSKVDSGESILEPVEDNEQNDDETEKRKEDEEEGEESGNRKQMIKFRTYRLPSNHYRKTREELLLSFEWEKKTAHYIKDDFINYLHEELQFQICKGEDIHNIYQLFRLPSTIESWDHVNTKVYLNGLGFPDVADRLFQQKTRGIDLLLLTREEIIGSSNLSLGRAIKLAAFLKRLHDVIV